jgi:hypothetical protein
MDPTRKNNDPTFIASHIPQVRKLLGESTEALERDFGKSLVILANGLGTRVLDLRKPSPSQQGHITKQIYTMG